MIACELYLSFTGCVLCTYVLKLYSSSTEFEYIACLITFFMQELRMGANQLAELSAERMTPLMGLVLLDLRENSIRRFFFFLSNSSCFSSSYD